MQDLFLVFSEMTKGDVRHATLLGIKCA